MSLTFALEKEVAVAAVMRACSLTSSVFNNLIKGETLSKDDKSPVTGLYAPYIPNIFVCFTQIAHSALLSR